MTAFETGKRIHYALRSLLAQTHGNLEILVMDDASGDDLGAVVARLRQEDPRIRYFRLPRNVGTYVAKELALRHLVRGDFVTCHDSDDWSHPRKIELQLEALLRHPKRVFSWSYWLRVQDDGLIVARQSHPLLRPNLSSVLFRREAVLDRAGGYDQVRTGADSEFLARLQLVFGRQAGARLRLPLAFGALRAGSLMTDGVTGIGAGTSTTPFRLAYWEAWRHWHLACQQQGRRPRMPERPADRPYPIPEGQAAETGPDLLAASGATERGAKYLPPRPHPRPGSRNPRSSSPAMSRPPSAACSGQASAGPALPLPAPGRQGIVHQRRRRAAVRKSPRRSQSRHGETRAACSGLCNALSSSRSSTSPPPSRSLPPPQAGRQRQAGKKRQGQGLRRERGGAEPGHGGGSFRGWSLWRAGKLRAPGRCLPLPPEPKRRRPFHLVIARRPPRSTGGRRGNHTPATGRHAWGPGCQPALAEDAVCRGGAVRMGRMPALQAPALQVTVTGHRSLGDCKAPPTLLPSRPSLGE